IRGSNYCLAWAPRDKNKIKTLPPELIDVSKNLVQATIELVQGSNESKVRVDPLILVLRPEHGEAPGGSGVMLGIKKELKDMLVKRGPMNNKKILEIRNKVRQQMKEELKSSEFWEEMRAELKARLWNA
nr:hypothetical protein [Tanacetum cinerariifolium]